MTPAAAILVTKLNAARRQLEIAIGLYFSEEDSVSIHTLTAAAYQLLADVNRARGGQPMLKEQAPTWVRPDLKKAARCKMPVTDVMGSAQRSRKTT